jgi:hypothetical protein
MVDVVDGTNAASQCVGGNAVLRVHNICASRVNTPGESVNGSKHSRADIFPDHVWERDGTNANAPVDRAKKRGVAAAGQCPHRDLLAQSCERFCQRDCVDHAAPGAGRVGAQVDVHGA